MTKVEKPFTDLAIVALHKRVQDQRHGDIKKEGLGLVIRNLPRVFRDRLPLSLTQNQYEIVEHKF